jgi:hypothetical protein
LYLFYRRLYFIIVYRFPYPNIIFKLPYDHLRIQNSLHERCFVVLSSPFSSSSFMNWSLVGILTQKYSYVMTKVSRQRVGHLGLFINPYEFLTTTRIWRLSIHVQCELGHTHPPRHSIWGSFPLVKHPKIAVQPSPLSSAEVENAWSYASTPHLCLQSTYGLYIPLVFTTLLKGILPRREMSSTTWNLNFMTLSSWYLQWCKSIYRENRLNCYSGKYTNINSVGQGHERDV